MSQVFWGISQWSLKQFTNILQNISFFVPQNKETHEGLEP